MSHYSVAVFTDEETNIEDLLEPYWEDLDVEPYLYMTKEELIAEGKEEIKYYQKIFKKYMKDKRKYRREHRNDVNHLRFVKKIPTMKKWNIEKIYKFAIRYYNPEKLGKNGELYSTYNPKSKWDWYEIGGRWKDMLVTNDGDRVNSALVKDINWNSMKEENIKELIPYNEFLEKSPYPKEYLKELYPTEEVYINAETEIITYAVLLPNGEWIEPGPMGWWGISCATPEEERKFIENYRENILKKADENWRLTIVDCHI